MNSEVMTVTVVQTSQSEAARDGCDQGRTPQLRRRNTMAL